MKTLIRVHKILIFFVVFGCSLTILWPTSTPRIRNWTWTWTWTWTQTQMSNFPSTIRCYQQSGNILRDLDDSEPVLGSSIFFHETSCPDNTSDITLTARQGCSVESALLAHPDKDVFLLLSSPVNISIEDTRNPVIQQLLTYPNFKVRHIYFSRYLHDTPLEVIDKTAALNYSLYPVVHASDVLRFATLYKFGGTYLDLDVMVLKPFKGMQNFAGAEWETTVGNGILNFGFDKIGREVAKDCAEEMVRFFKGTSWAFNGPGVMSRVFAKRCNTNNFWKMINKTCQGFHVHPMKAFSPVPYWKPHLFFKEGNTARVQKLLNRSHTVHLWSHDTFRYILNNTKLDIPYLKYAKLYCPKVYKIVKGIF